VTDAQAASVAKARVEVTNTATGVTATTSTNDSGFYAVSGVGARHLYGRFQVQVSTLELTNIE